MNQDEVTRLQSIVKKLQSEDGCPWDRVQTHESIKAGCIEEACEVLAGINILKETGKADNLKEDGTEYACCPRCGAEIDDDDTVIVVVTEKEMV